MRYACLLRGINVSGHRRIGMAELCGALAADGLENVVSYLQSGNILFDAQADGAGLTDRVTRIIAEAFGHPDVDALVLDSPRLKRIVAACPIAPDRDDVSKWHFTFLLGPPAEDAAAAAQADRDRFLPERYFAGDGLVYAFCPDGYRRTKIGNDFIERRLKVRATTRNYNTTTKLAEMLG
jgi:uncharacterized protein (DUF1697 family)